ncbi:MAG: hypothetical protein FWE45_00785 [Firmicutes bacterium]|nr:hypothetical protein [Bacillota bacterium]
MQDLGKHFEHILDDGEEIVKTFKPNRRATANSFFFFFWAIPLLWPILIISFPIMYPIYRAYYNKRVYAYTNKRILVRGGIIGTDYKSLDLPSVNATLVHVGFIDKISKKNTGTLEFGSPANPIGMTNSNGMKVNPFIFNHIENPYDEHKIVKQYIASVKDK